MKDLFTIARKKGGAIVWTEAQKRYIIEQYLIKKNSNLIGEQFGVSGAAIRRLLRKEKIEIINHRLRLPRNSNFFENIDNVKKAYWLGIMYSDGYVIESKLGLGLGMIDQEHIEKFKQAIGATEHKISYYLPTNSNKYCYEIVLNDQKMYYDLNKLNVVPKKSNLEIPFPDFLQDDELIRHFIRGYYDGDGSFCYSIKNNDFKVSFVGNKTFLTGLRAYLHKEKISLTHDKRTKATYAFNMRGRNQVKNFLEWLYKDTDTSIRLDRKYNKFQEFLTYLGSTSLNS